jgi:hypothetical protein
MFRRMMFPLGALALLAGMSLTLTAKALMIAPPPVGMRAATASAVVVGKVTKLAEKTVPAEMYKGDMQQMMIATVKVEENLLGKPAKEIQVGYVVPMEAGPGGPLGRPIRRGPMVNLVVDQEALLMLQPHPTKKDVFIATDFFGIINKKDNPNFKAELEEVRKSAKILASPMAALKSKNADERFNAAALLISRYYTPVGPMSKTEKVPTAESKLILEALAEADWKADRGPFGYAMNPQNMFFRLNLMPADGWNQPRDFNTIEAEAKKWLKANAGKYQLTRHVRPTQAVGVDPEP